MAQVKNPRKRANYLNTDLGPETQAKFLARNLNDDRYMSVAVKNYLEDCLLFPEDGRKRHVTAVAGGATGNLRWVWGLNFGEGNIKDRADDRHHAIDAAIIAACSESTVKKAEKRSNSSASLDLRTRSPGRPLPLKSLLVASLLFPPAWQITA